MSKKPFKRADILRMEKDLDQQREILKRFSEEFHGSLKAHLSEGARRMGYHFSSERGFIEFAIARMTRQIDTDGKTSTYLIDDTPFLKVTELRSEIRETKPMTYEQRIGYQFEHLR